MNTLAENDIKTITLTIIENPLEAERTRKSIQLAAWGKYVSEILPEYINPAEWIVINDGKALSPDKWHTTLLQPGGEVICYPQIKDSMTQIFTGFVLLVASGLPGMQWLAPFAASMMIGGVASDITAKLAPTPNSPDFSEDPTYGFAGIRTNARIGSPIPVVYGEHKVGGQYIELSTRADSDDNDVLHALIALSEGEIDSISDIKINNQSESNYNNVFTESNTGTNNQSAITLFGDNTTTTYPADALIDESWLTYTFTGTNITAWELNIIFPMGLFRTKKNGKMISASVTLDIEYKLTSEPTVWTSYGQVTITDSKRSTLRRTIRQEGLAAGQYDIRVKRTTPESTGTRRIDQVRRSSVNEIVNDAYIYPNVALLAVKAVATDQISGGLPNITCKIKGRKVRVFTDTTTYTTQWSDNPAWVVLDMLTNSRYGMAMSDSDLDIQSFIDWASFCDTLVDDGNGGTEKRAICDIVFNRDGEKIWDAVLKVCGQSYATLVKVGNMIRVKIEKTESPVQLFTMANMVKGSFKETFMPLKDRANYFEIQFLNKDNDYQQDIITLEDPLIYTNSEAVNKQTVSAYGVTRSSHAARLTRFYYRTNRYVTRIIQFEVGIDAVACEPGDVIRFQHDVPQWGFGTRAASGSTSNTIVLDTPMTIESSKTYEVLVRHSDDTVEQKAVTNTPGTYTTLTISGTWTSIPQDGDVVAFGETNISVKPFRIIAIERTEEMTAKITGLEYNSSIYDETDLTAVNIVNYSALPDPFAPPPHVSDLTLSQLDDAQYTVWVSFTPPNDSRYATAYIYQVVGSRNVKIGESREGEFGIASVVPGTTLTIKVVSVSRVGSQADISTAPSATITVATGALPPDITGLELVGQGNNTEFVGKDAKFQWRDRGRTSGFGFEGLGQETLGAGAGGREGLFKNYRVGIYNTDGTLRRREYVVDPFYTYSYEKNYEDAQNIGGQVVRSFTTKVWQQDIFNQLSAKPAILTVSNPAPPIVGNLKITGLRKLILLQWDKSTEPDVIGYKVWRSTTSGFTPNDATDLVSEGIYNLVQFDDVTPGTNYYFKVAAYDTFGETGLNISGEVSANPSGLIGQDIADLAITLGKIADDSVSTGKLQDLAVTVQKIADGAITTQKVAALAITSTEISDDAITTPKIAANAVTANEIAAVTITANEIAAGTITGNEIAALAIATAHIAAGAVTANEIAALTITANEIASGAITTAKITAGAVTADEIAAGAITATHISTNEIITDAANIASAVIIDAHIGNLSADKINTGTLNGDRISADTITANHILPEVIEVSNYERAHPSKSFLISSGTYWLTIASVQITTASGTKVIVIGKVGNAGLAGSSNYALRIKRDSTVLDSAGYESGGNMNIPIAQPATCMDVDSPGIGTYTYYLEIYASFPTSSNYLVESPKLIVMELN